MVVITIWHNPRCSKSRQTLALVEASGKPYTVRKYLEDAPTLAELEQAKAALNLSALQMLRPTEALFKELGLNRSDDEATLLAAAAAHPALIERPIVLSKGRAIIGRPPEAVAALL